MKLFSCPCPKFLSSNLASLVIIFSWLVWAVFRAFGKAIDLPTLHLDGAFQTASGLYRLNAGQFPGKDFFPYLGIAPLYALFPLFKVFGSNLASSVAASYFAVQVCAAVSCAFIFHMIWKPKSWLTSLAMGGLVFAFYGIFAGITHLDFLYWGFIPGNSLRLIRSFAPYFAAIVLYAVVFRDGGLRFRPLTAALAGLLTAGILLWSNDYAFSTAFLLGALILIWPWLRSGSFSLKNYGIYAGVAVLAGAGLYYLGCHGHPLPMLRYNFIDAARDQWWYFAPYREETRIFSSWELVKFAVKTSWSGWFLFAVLGFRALRHRSLPSALLLWIGLALLAGGIVASAGGHIDDGYFGAYDYWLGTAYFFCGLRWIWLRMERKSPSAIPAWRTGLAGILKAAALTMLVFGAVSAHGYMHRLAAAKRDPGRFFVPELGGYLSTDWSDYIQLARTTPRDLLVLEEYWGIWSALRRTFFIWPVDSLIHALGELRNVALGDMQRADIIISTKRTGTLLAKEWQPWNLSENYWFYDYLLTHYSVSSVSPSTLVWRKTGSVAPEGAWVPCTPSPSSAGHFLVNVSAPDSGYYEVAMRYHARNRGKNLLLVQNHIDFSTFADGYISLNPAADSAKFPAYFGSAGPAALDVKMMGRDTTLEVSSCSVRALPYRDEDVFAFPPFVIVKEPK